MTEKETIRIRMLKNVRGNSYISPPGTIARAGLEYKGESNPQGAISAILPNGESLGVKPGEFEFLEAPEWILRIWAKHDPNIHCEIRVPEKPMTGISDP